MQTIRKVAALKSAKTGSALKRLLESIAAGEDLLNLRKGAKLFSQGAEADAIYFIQSGELRVTVVSAQGKEAVVASLLARNVNLEEDLCDQLFNHSEKRLARILLKLARFGLDEELPDTKVPKFIENVTPTYVDFVMHSRPFFLSIVSNFRNYRFRTRMESVVKRIPIAHARWIGNQLGQLSAEQIRDSFRAGGFSPSEVDGYTRVVTQRIAALKKL